MRSKSSAPSLSPKKKPENISPKRATEEEEELKPIKRSKGGLLSPERKTEGPKKGLFQPEAGLFEKPKESKATGSLSFLSKPAETGDKPSLFGGKGEEGASLFGKPKKPEEGALFGGDKKEGASLFGNPSKPSEGSLFGNEKKPEEPKPEVSKPAPASNEPKPNPFIKNTATNPFIGGSQANNPFLQGSAGNSSQAPKQEISAGSSSIKLNEESVASNKPGLFGA
jgi:hypothetical protein